MDLTAAIANAAHSAALNTLREAVSGAGRDEVADKAENLIPGLIDGASEGTDAAIAFDKQLATQPPVFQLTAFPQPIDSRAYVNPRTNSNPRGDYASLFAFRALVDPIPAFTHYYSASGSSTETAWEELVTGAAVQGDSSFARNSLARAQQVYEQSKVSNLDGSLGSWHPAYATPENWYDFSIAGRFVDFEIDLSNPDSPMSGFVAIPGGGVPPALNWLIAPPGCKPVPVGLDPRTRLKALRAKALVVTITRQWLNLDLFRINGLYLPGQPSGLYSSGTLQDNDGLMPLIPSAFCLAVGVEIAGDWSPAWKCWGRGCADAMPDGARIYSRLTIEDQSRALLSEALGQDHALGAALRVHDRRIELQG
ncbi:MAG TPA: hypothetical protein VE093_08820 [Polyangiaceae bacterium]|nr:hypothetical protein [Polyangiaceae bacterium]